VTPERKREFACIEAFLCGRVDLATKTAGFERWGWLGGIGSEVTLRCFVGLMFGFLAYKELAACW
jgi:hypothetical protein